MEINQPLWEFEILQMHDFKQIYTTGSLFAEQFHVVQLLWGVLPSRQK